MGYKQVDDGVSRELSSRVLDWFDAHGRKHLPWQEDITPYRVWVSEIMLQQTQVATVIPYFQRFMQRFPSVDMLAEASEDEVLALWSGLGYYARGRNLHAAAKQVVEKLEGSLPCQRAALESLPGIGRSTAGAIASIACGAPEVILDGNVKRVLSRFHAVEGWPGQSAVLKRLWSLAESHRPVQRFGDYSQAMMDLGATLCTRTRPACERCPLQSDCRAHAIGEPTSFPYPKPKKARPHKVRQFLLLENSARELFMQRRAASGLWGGLWSFPELEEDVSARDWVEENLAMMVKSKDTWPAFSHAFSHYDLTVVPVHIRTDSALDRVMEMEQDEAVWYNSSQSLPGGVPTPVQQLIQQYQASILTDTSEH
ncbi:MAG: A/G-specific adenine glycosylase [bacterium]